MLRHCAERSPVGQRISASLVAKLLMKDSGLNKPRYAEQSDEQVNEWIPGCVI
jgi:hypothetical protein